MPPRLSLLLEPDRSRVARRRDRHCDLGSGICEAVHLSGGEPAARRDIVEITAAAHRASLYTNLITSAVGLTEKKLAALAEARLDHVQISIQDADAASADRRVRLCRQTRSRE
jgi:MoaA/NifB/PqqE/SkfB family radical SAM enzyme